MWSKNDRMLRGNTRPQTSLSLIKTVLLVHSAPIYNAQESSAHHSKTSMEGVPPTNGQCGGASCYRQRNICPSCMPRALSGLSRPLDTVHPCCRAPLTPSPLFVDLSGCRVDRDGEAHQLLLTMLLSHLVTRLSLLQFVFHLLLLLSLKVPIHIPCQICKISLSVHGMETFVGVYLKFWNETFCIKQSHLKWKNSFSKYSKKSGFRG